MSSASIDLPLLLRVLYTSVVAGVGVSVVFSLTVLGVIRSGEMRRARRSGAATGYAVLAAVGATLAMAIIVFGLILLARKS